MVGFFSSENFFLKEDIFDCHLKILKKNTLKRLLTAKIGSRHQNQNDYDYYYNFELKTITIMITII